MLSQYYGLDATHRAFLFIPGAVFGFFGSLAGAR